MSKQTLPTPLSTTLDEVPRIMVGVDIEVQIVEAEHPISILLIEAEEATCQFVNSVEDVATLSLSVFKDLSSTSHDLQLKVQLLHPPPLLSPHKLTSHKPQTHKISPLPGT
uniref:Uncharacterized protein n=1 Tax=Cannabis sativa TaxID=3483 RepID=A0A803P405_CANSA